MISEKKWSKPTRCGDTSIRKLAARFEVSKAVVQRLLKQKQRTCHVQPKKQGGSIKSELQGYSTQLAQMVENYPDFTLSEYCEYWGETYAQWFSSSTMCRALQKEKLTRKKAETLGVAEPPPKVFKTTLRSSQCATERVQKLRCEYWQQVQLLPHPENLVFLDETGVELGRHLLG